MSSDKRNVVFAQYYTLGISSSVAQVLFACDETRLVSLLSPQGESSVESCLTRLQLLRDTLSLSSPFSRVLKRFSRAFQVGKERFFCAKSVDHGGKKRGKKERRRRLAAVVIAVTITSRSPACTETCFPCCVKSSCSSKRAFAGACMCADEFSRGECHRRVLCRLYGCTCSVEIRVLLASVHVCMCVSARGEWRVYPMQIVHLPLSLTQNCWLRQSFAKLAWLLYLAERCVCVWVCGC